MANISSLLFKVCVCVCVRTCVRVCVCVKDVVLYKNRTFKFYIDHSRIKVKVTVPLQMFSLLTAIQTFMSYISTLVQAGKLILSMLSSSDINKQFLNIITLE